MWGTDYITKSVSETIQRGMIFASELKNKEPNAVVLLYGEMGAGKTHFVKGMAMGLGISGLVNSPTFALVNDYGGLYHFDLFRIKTLDDLEAIGFYDYIENGVLAIEWAENIPELENEFEKYHTVKIKKRSKSEESTERVIEINEVKRGENPFG